MSSFKYEIINICIISRKNNLHELLPKSNNCKDECIHILYNLIYDHLQDFYFYHCLSIKNVKKISRLTDYLAHGAGDENRTHVVSLEG